MSTFKAENLSVKTMRESAAMVRLREISKTIDGNEKKYHATLYQNIADVCIVAESIKGPRAWKAFKNDAFWPDEVRENAQPSDKLRLVFEAGFNNVGPKIRSEYRLAAEYLLEYAAPEDLPDEFQSRGGLRAVLNERRKRDRQTCDQQTATQNLRKIIAELEFVDDPAELLNAKKDQCVAVGLEIFGKRRNKFLGRVVHYCLL